MNREMRYEMLSHWRWQLLSFVIKEKWGNSVEGGEQVTRKSLFHFFLKTNSMIAC